MKILSDFEFKQRKYMPVFPKATGKPTTYIEGYPYEDDEPMSATGFHGEQITTFAEQLSARFENDPDIYIGIDSFIYYRKGDIQKFVAPDVYVSLGAAKLPQRRSFYTWSEGAVPTTIFEFLSDSTAHRDRDEKVEVYLRDMGAEEYFIHQPELEKPSEFRGWRQSLSGGIVEIEPEVDPEIEGGLFSAALNLLFRYEEQFDNDLRLLRPYLPDGTPFTTAKEERRLRAEAEDRATEAEDRATEAETLATVEAERRRKAEAELERLRAQLARNP